MAPAKKQTTKRAKNKGGGLDAKTPTSLQHQVLPRDPSSGRVGGAALSLGAGRGLAPSLELLLNSPGGEGAGSFMILSDGGRTSRVYLGRINMGDDEGAQEYVAVKLQTDRPSIDASEDAAGRLTHAAREMRWRRELGHYRAVQNSAEGFTRLFFTRGGSERSGQSRGPVSWPPLLYCSEREVLFQPVDSRGVPLITCRDEEALAEAGLPPYADSVTVFLTSAERPPEGEQATYYQFADEGERVHPRAQSFAACLQSQSELRGLPGREAPELDSGEAIDRFASLAASTPCLTCPKREECYPDGSHAERLKPFRFEDSNALVLELNDYHYDEFSDLLGGIGMKAFAKQYMGPGASAGQLFRLRDAESLIQFNRRYMFGSDGSGLDALEIFKLKWTLFAQTCQATFEYHRRTGVAHLKAEPRHVMVKMNPIVSFLPSMWQFRARLISLGSVALETRPEQGETEEILALPANSSPVYDAEIIRNSAFGVVQRGGFILTGLEQDSEGRHVISCEIAHEGLGMDFLSLKDRIKVIIRPQVDLKDGLSFFTLRDPDKEYAQSTLYLKSHPIELTEEQESALGRLYGVKLGNGGFALYPQFHVPCDIYSLGMLLFRTLTVNDAQAMGDVSMALEGLKRDLVAERGVACEEGSESEFWQALLEDHKGRDVAEIFSVRQVFHNDDDRDPERPNAIPQPIWDEAMVLGLQMITTIEGFSFCDDHGDFDRRYPAGKVEPVVRATQDILRKIDATLLSMSRRNAEVRAAIEAVVAEAGG